MEIERAGLAKYQRVVKSLSKLLKKHPERDTNKLFWVMKRLEQKLGARNLPKAGKDVIWKAVIGDKKSFTDAVRGYKIRKKR